MLKKRIAASENHVGRGLAVCLAALALAFAGFTARGEDVYAKAFYWCRGMGVDANGNGRLDSGELYDSLNLPAPESSSVGANHPVFTNEMVRMPYRGVLRQTQCLYLPQEVVITNEATHTGVLRPNAFALPAYVANALADKPHFAVAIRFRPDLTQTQKDYRWIFSCGHETMRGFMFGFTATGNHTMTFNANKYTITNQWANATFYCGGKSWQPNTDYCKINLGAWNDVVLSVDGRKVAILVSRDGYYDPRTATSVTNSTLAWFNTTYYATTVPDGYDVSPKPNKTFMIGTEYYSSDRVAWSTNVTSNASKTFRGSIQSIAVWTNALTEAEMRAAAAWPRLDLWRVGVENDATTEFNGSGAATTTDVDADRWTAPTGLAAGGTATFRFPLNTTGEAEMPEVFRIKPTGASGAGTLRVTVNGADLGTKTVGPGRTTRWFVPETLLLAGATNVLQVTRTDAGGTPVNIDVASFGGSLQYGERDNSHYEFAMEGKYQNPNANVYQLIRANWFDSARALFGANGSSAHTNTVIKFDVPEDILQNYDWRMKFRTATAGHTVSMSLNGTALGNYTSGTEHSDIEIPEGLMRTTGNELKMANTATFKAGSYFAPDYVRLYLVDRPGGTMAILR